MYVSYFIVIVAHRPRLKDLYNKHYVFEYHMIKEIVTVNINKNY